jgi:hypothetical protein
MTREATDTSRTPLMGDHGCQHEALTDSYLDVLLHAARTDHATGIRFLTDTHNLIPCGPMFVAALIRRGVAALNEHQAHAPDKPVPGGPFLIFVCEPWGWEYRTTIPEPLTALAHGLRAVLGEALVEDPQAMTDHAGKTLVAAADHRNDDLDALWLRHDREGYQGVTLAKVPFLGAVVVALQDAAAAARPTA